MHRVNMAITGIMASMFLVAGCMLSAEEDLAANEADGTEHALAAMEDTESLSPLALGEAEEMSVVTDDVQATDEESAALVSSDLERSDGYWKCKAWDKHCHDHCEYYYSEHKKKHKAKEKAEKKCERDHDKCKVDCKWYD